MELNLFDKKINNRHSTLIANIKSKSNSYYDSFLDLLEETIKYILDNNNIIYNKNKTCGLILKEESVKNFFLDNIKLELYTYEKLLDYIKKCNDHKHKKEKQLNIESVTNYLSIYFDLINCYKKYIKEDVIVYDKEYYISIYGEVEKLNTQYKEEVYKLQYELKDVIEENKLSQGELDEYRSLLTFKEIENIDLEKQNKILLGQIITLNKLKENYALLDKITNIEKQQEEIKTQNEKLRMSLNIMNDRLASNLSNSKEDDKKLWIKFITNAYMEYIYPGTNEQLVKNKKNIFKIGIILILIGVVNTILSHIQLGFYSTYIFFVNLFMIATFIILIKNIGLKKNISDYNLSKRSLYKFKMNGMYHYESTYKKKRSYLILFILALGGIIMEILLILISYKSKIMYVGIPFHIAFVVLMIIFYKENLSLYELFEVFIRYKGHKLNTNEPITIWYESLQQKIYSDLEFKEKYKTGYIE